MVTTTAKRLRMMAAVCAMTLTLNILYDCPATLNVSLRSHLHLSKDTYQWLLSAIYSVGMIPNIALPMLSGVVMQKHGRYTVSLVATLCVVLGQLVFAAAIGVKLRFLILTGRFIFGLGSEVLGLVAYDVVTEYFADFHLNAAIAVLLTVGRLGSTANFLTTPSLVQTFGITKAVWMITSFSLILMICGCARCLVHFSLHDTPQSTTPYNLVRTVKSMPRRFWYFIVVCIFGYACVNTFTNTIVDFLADWFYDQNAIRSSSVSSILPILSSVLVPVVGLVLERPSTKILRFLQASFVLMLLGHLMFLVVNIGPIFPLIALGTSFAIYGVAFWSMLISCLIRESDSSIATAESDAFLEDESQDEAEMSFTEHSSTNTSAHRLSTVGIGIATSVTNLVTGAVPLCLAALQHVSGFTGVEVAYFVCAVFGCLATLRLNFIPSG